MAQVFSQKGADVLYVELKADLSERLKRNRDPHRLAYKPSKRDVVASEESLLHFETNCRMNTLKNEFTQKQILVIDNTNTEPFKVARLIKQWIDQKSRE